jgi:serine/threonine protein phosphatase 1
MIPVYPENKIGRDFIIGDLHGQVHLLREKMAEKRFDVGCDRLFATGDLVDRGKDSEGAVELLNEPWFFSVMGNHDDCAIQFATGQIKDLGWYAGIGGAWMIGHTRDERLGYAIMLQTLPIALEIEIGDGRRVGVVHADCPFDDWEKFRASQVPDASRSILQETAIRNTALWSRGRREAMRDDDVSGIHAVIVGHTPVERVTSLGNVFYVDTGCGKSSGRLTMKRIKKLVGA